MLHSQSQILPESDVHRLGLHCNGLASTHINRGLCALGLCWHAHGLSHLDRESRSQSSLEGKGLAEATMRTTTDRRGYADILRNVTASHGHCALWERIVASDILSGSIAALAQQYATSGRHAYPTERWPLHRRAACREMGMEVAGSVVALDAHGCNNAVVLDFPKLVEPAIGHFPRSK